MQLSRFRLTKREKMIEMIERIKGMIHKGGDWVTFEGNYPDFASVPGGV